MSAENSIRGLFLRTLRRRVEKAIKLGVAEMRPVYPARAPKGERLELTTEELLGLLDLVDDLIAALAKPPRAMICLGSDDARALVDGLAGLRLKVDFAPEPTTEDRERPAGPRSWGVVWEPDGDGRRSAWVARSGEMVAAAPTQELLARAMGMCTVECPVVHIDADGRLRCECEDDDDSGDHDDSCPLHRHNAASYAYAQEIGQLS